MRNRSFGLGFLVVLLVVCSAACAPIRNLGVTASRWQFKIDDAAKAVKVVAEQLGSMKGACKLDPGEVDALEVKLDMARKAIGEADKAWNQWQSHVGVEHGIGAALDTAKLVTDEAAEILEAYQIRADRNCGK